FGLIEAGGGPTSDTAGDIDLDAFFETRLINISGGTNLIPDMDGAFGNVDVSTSGKIQLIETDGDLRVGLIESATGDVDLSTATGSIIDAPDDGNDTSGDAGADVVGNKVSLFTPAGGIGTQANPLDIDSSDGDGVLTATAKDDIFITETTGDLNVNLVQSTAGHSRLVSATGSILDGSDSAAANVSGSKVDLVTPVGAIGASSNFLEIDSSNSSAGRLFATASDGIFITETSGELNVLVATSQTGDVQLRVVDSAVVGDDLSVIDTGTDLSTQMNNHTGTISADDSLSLQAGDDVTIPGGVSVTATGLTISVDPAGGNADTAGGTATVNAGSIAGAVILNGGPDEDFFDITAAPGADFSIDGRDPTFPSVPGDTLLIDPLGNSASNLVTGPGTGTIQISGFNRIDYTSIETVDLQDINDGPINIVPEGPHVTTQDVPLTFSINNQNALAISDGDAGAATDFFVTLTTGTGTLSVTAIPGLGVSGDGSLGSPLVLTGTLAQINTTFRAGLTYLPDTGFLGTDELVTTSNDQGNSGSGGAQFDVDIIDIVVADNLAGDYNENGTVGAEDYVRWRDTLGQSVSPGTGTDGSSNGIVGLEDYLVWKITFGNTKFGSSESAAVGEDPQFELASMQIGLMQAAHAEAIRQSTMLAGQGDLSFLSSSLTRLPSNLDQDAPHRLLDTGSERFFQDVSDQYELILAAWPKLRQLAHQSVGLDEYTTSGDETIHSTSRDEVFKELGDDGVSRSLRRIRGEMDGNDLDEKQQG
ncbi:MAG: hypothetical protein ACR2NU_02440, partial [Aeoliella sp.]